MIPGKHSMSLAGYQVFIPDRLPPKLKLGTSAFSMIEKATYLLGQVEMCRTLLPNADLLIYSSLQREAIASSTIEGTVSSPEELVLYQISKHTERESVREVANYRAALEWGYKQLPVLPITTRLILGLHERLMQGVRGASHAGQFKVHQNYLVSTGGSRIEDAIFVPPPPEHIPILVRDLETYLNEDNQEPKIVQCALAHYQFETIHPFSDGNGRVGRLLIILHLIQLGLLSAPLIYPSVYFESTRMQYYDHLQKVREKGAWNEWIEYFAKGIINQCEETITLTKTILSLRQNLRDKVAHVSRRATLTSVLETFFHDPVLSVSEIRKYSGLVPNSISSALEEMEQLEIVAEITGKQKGRVYACLPILRAIFGDDSGWQQLNAKISADNE